MPTSVKHPATILLLLAPQTNFRDKKIQVSKLMTPIYVGAGINNMRSVALS